MNKYNATKVIVTEDGTLFTEWIVKKHSLDVTGKRFDSVAEGSTISCFSSNGSMGRSKTLNVILSLFYKRSQRSLTLLIFW